MLGGVFTTAVCLGLFTAVSTQDFECSSEQTQISSSYLYKEGTDCGTLIGEIVDFYNEAYLSECQRWLALSQKPHRVGDAYIDQCYQFPNGTTRYRSKICCEGTITTQRCMTCVDVPVTGDYIENCNHYRTVETCRPGQVCLTQYNHRNVGNETRCIAKRSLTKMCVDENVCDALATNNSKSCKHYENPVTCSYCCSGPFCNYQTQRIIHYNPCARPRPTCYYGGTYVTNTSLKLGYHCICPPNRHGYQCRSNYCNCKNGGFCTVTTTPPYYSCDCQIGWTGQNCTTAYELCSSTYCLNGGTCYDHKDFGLRCKCPPGFVGAKCEFKALECKIPSLYYSSHTYHVKNGWNCTGEYEYRKKLTTTYKGYCENKFRWNRFGTVNKVPAIGTKSCAKGDVRYWAVFEQCCPACHSNPCQNGGWCVELENQDHICKCRYGFEGKNCENKVAVCFASGDPHFRTFDGQMLHFQGQCMYTLAANDQSTTAPGLPDFQVNIQTEHRGDDTLFTYPRFIEINVFGYKVKLDRGKKVYVDSNLITVPASYPGFKIIFNGKYVRLETNFSVSVEYDGEWTSFVKVPPQYSGATTGICGNYDGVVVNDYTTKDGRDVSKDLENRDWDLASSFQVNNPENGDKCVSIKQVIPKCDEDMKKRVASKMICGFIKDTTGPFETCLSKQVVKREDFYFNCEYDSCAVSFNATRMKAASCRNLAVLADSCEQKGFLLDWREIANCPLGCKGNSTYVRKGSACPATCRNPTAPETCTLPNTETCECPEGTLLQGEECVEECGCEYEGKNYEIGETWVTEDCRQMSCNMCNGTDCEGDAGVVEELSEACESDEKCSNGKCVPVCSYTFKESDCEDCEMLDNQVGFLGHPCECSKYIQCERIGDRWQGFIKDCADCTCWNQETLTCERISENCTLDEEMSEENITNYGDFCMRGESSFEAHMDNTKFYQWTDTSRVEMACPCGTVFDAVKCGCIHSADTSDCQTPEEVTCLSFDSGWNGFGTTNWVWVSQGGVTIASNDCVQGNCGFFDGNSKLEIPFFTNAYSSYSEISISFWYKRSSDSSGEQGLVSNTVCSEDHSILVSSEDADEVGGGIKTEGNDFEGVSGVNASDGQWHHVVLSYDGSQIDFYVDNVKQNSPTTSGSLENSQCPLVFGHMAKGNFFSGYMDEICIYKKGLTAQQVSMLYFTAFFNHGVSLEWLF